MKTGAKLEHERLAKVAFGYRLRNDEDSANAREFAAAGEVTEQRRILALFEERLQLGDNPEAAQWAIEVIRTSTDSRYLS
jgi:hypothetical protein